MSALLLLLSPSITELLCLVFLFHFCVFLGLTGSTSHRNLLFFSFCCCCFSFTNGFGPRLLPLPSSCSGIPPLCILGPVHMDAAGGGRALRVELDGANRLAEFRLQKVIELKAEVLRLRRLLLSLRGGSEALERVGLTKKKRNSGESLATCMAEATKSGVTRLTQEKRRVLSSPSPCIYTATAAAVSTEHVMSPGPRVFSMASCVSRGASRTPIAAQRRQESSAARCGSHRLSSPLLLTSSSLSTKAKPKATTRPFIKLHTGVELRGPKTFRRVPPPLSLATCLEEAAHTTSMPTATTTALDVFSAGAITPPASPSSRFCSSLAIRQEHEGVREALAMLRGIVLRADRSMLSTLTTLSNRRHIDHALPTALAEFKQCLLRVHPSLGDKLHDGEAWCIDEAERDALEVMEVPGMAAALRDVVITYDYTACIHQNILHQEDGMVGVRLGKAFHEFHANIYVLLALAQCVPAALR
ncbi:hypothetical protein ECC02_007808 [Trypanosoma cruzi]|nr:hypothetical protein ECC02_007808 [Trypanosoma cruzi]